MTPFCQLPLLPRPRGDPYCWQRHGLTFGVVGGRLAVFIGEATLDSVHIHAPKGRQGRVVELLLHTGQWAAHSLQGEEDRWRSIQVGRAFVPGHQVYDTGHHWGREGRSQMPFRVGTLSWPMLI